MFASFVAYFFARTAPGVAASSAVLFMVSNINSMKLAWLEILAVFNKKIQGLVATVEKNGVLLYRTMHSSYQITAPLDKEHSGSEDSLRVAFTTHCVQEGKSPLHMKSP